LEDTLISIKGLRGVTGNAMGTLEEPTKWKTRARAGPRYGRAIDGEHRVPTKIDAAPTICNGLLSCIDHP